VTGFSLTRVAALVLRYSYVLRSSWLRMLDTIYWPVAQLVTWGFLQTYLLRVNNGQFSTVETATGALIGGVLLLDILFRAQQGFSFSFLEDIWSRNVANLLMSPMRPAEFIAALMTMSLIRLVLGTVPITILAIFFFGFNLWSLGVALAAFFVVLVLFSWSVGLVISGLLLRYGMGAESLAWTVMFAIQPLGCVYYPVAVLPGWLQPICWALPPTYVFEGLRSILIRHEMRWDLLAQGFAIDLALFAAAAIAFSRLLKAARRAGTLLQSGE